MATYTTYKLKSGKTRYVATVYNGGNRLSKSFPTKRDATIWAADIERANTLANGNFTFCELLKRYKAEISPRKKHPAKERMRIDHLIGLYPWLFNKRAADLSRQDVARWRDERLKTVGASTVLKEWTILSHCLKVARIEWELVNTNPFAEVKKPSEPPPRNRLISDDEVEKMLFVCCYSDEVPPTKTKQRVAAAFLFALETALRAQEVCNLTWDNVFEKHCHVPKSKSYDGVRDVPLSTRARELLQIMRSQNLPTVFGLNTYALDYHFRLNRKKANLEGFTFHDARATAITRMACKLEPYDLARIVGHSDLSKIMVYYRKKAADIADKLD